MAERLDRVTHQLRERHLGFMSGILFGAQRAMRITRPAVVGRVPNGPDWLPALDSTTSVPAREAANHRPTPVDAWRAKGKT
ncbi:hypothetical protein [Streptomyces sp. NPDC056544]|uniref:hypothetical protein n=1 Tax=unclassified Streptomyces TaxID=2593676 RepID=UPI0036B54F9C